MGWAGDALPVLQTGNDTLLPPHADIADGHQAAGGGKARLSTCVGTAGKTRSLRGSQSWAREYTRDTQIQIGNMLVPVWVFWYSSWGSCFSWEVPGLCSCSSLFMARDDFRCLVLGPCICPPIHGAEGAGWAGGVMGILWVAVAGTPSCLGEDGWAPNSPHDPACLSDQKTP